MKKIIFFLLLGVFINISSQTIKKTEIKKGNKMSEKRVETAIFGAGCFWCVEAIFQQLKGVNLVESGYCGGNVENPTYQQVCSGSTKHAEVCRIKYNPDVISYDELLEIFWQSHNPTTLNRQGADVGTQYRSVIFCMDSLQQEKAEYYKRELENLNVYEDKIVTQILPAKPFYPAEDYHQDYYDQNKNKPYCAFTITPKLDKLKKVFSDKLKNK